MESASPRRLLDERFTAVQTELLRMGDLVARANDQSVQAWRARDRALAEQVVAGDAELNRMRYEVEESCLAMIATQQPAAGDLRAILAMDSLAVELERMGDHAEGIAKIVLRMGDEPPIQPLPEIPAMGELCRKMLAESLQTFAARDPKAAHRVGEQDDEIDRLYRALFDRVVAAMAKDPSIVERGTYLLWIAHNLERIGDRITNISERVIFMTTGRIGMIYP
ncbi:MAG: phosphate signaling complex protein PhoU [Anaerolineales bacterium]|nr:phosphate signaling complex protein PhoU [Anaerolineales bacterium]